MVRLNRWRGIRDFEKGEERKNKQSNRSRGQGLKNWGFRDFEKLKERRMKMKKMWGFGIERRGGGAVVVTGKKKMEKN